MITTTSTCLLAPATVMLSCHEPCTFNVGAQLTALNSV